jgi:MFS family permease
VKNKHDYSALIIWAALLVTVARYVGAFLASDLGEVNGWVSEGLTILMGVSGLGMGVLDVLGLAYVFDGWRKVLPKAGDHWSSRFKVLTGFVASLFVAGVCILVPFTVSRISSQSMAEALGGKATWGVWFWSLAVNLAPYLLIGGVTFSQAGFVTIRHEAESLQPVAQPVAEVAQISKRERILELHHAQPSVKSGFIAGQVGVSRQYVDKVISNNGKAQEVRE